ncbi:PIN domain-containing protein [Crocosphaera sp.]|uniref:type II toxin-antitoxin system VapC family toxin n=1 Tax=Crocosphaera sp. TaxID=2729996 RepID=UPI00262D1D7C|nr:PIN domain-containing protein [Crocosphaera sp.]MDJ0578630.1 PIN domain-containing protein [Crocosphaera sp.]
MAFLLDTNILLRMIDLDHPMNKDVTNSIKSLRSQNEQLFIISQNLIEFWNVCTRPLEKNGLGMTVSETEGEVSRIENIFIVLPDTSKIYLQWRNLVKKYQVKGVKVHDTRLVAAMLVYEIDKILTFNVNDFRRFSEITAIHPTDIS